MSIKNVAVVGASGSVGMPVVAALRKSFKVTAFTRNSSSSPSKFPSDVSVVSIPDGYPVDEVAEALKGQDAVVLAVALDGITMQHDIIDAAIRAGVKRIIPSEFGGDTSKPETDTIVPSIWGRKRQVVKYLQSKESEGLSWTAIITGFFFDYSFHNTHGRLLHLDLEKRTAWVQDDGEYLVSMSNMSQIALSVVRVLQKPEETKNKFIYVQSFLMTQNQLIAGVEKELGEKFEVTKVNNKEYVAENAAKTKANPHDMVTAFDTVYAWIVSHGNNTLQSNYANELLGLPDEDFDSSLKKALADIRH